MCKRFILAKLEAAAAELQRSVWEVEVSICCQPWIRRASTPCHEEGLTCLSVIENIYFAKSSTEWRTYLRELAIAREGGVLVQPEMDSGRSPLASIAPFWAGQSATAQYSCG